MGNASGELAEALHPMRLVQTRLQQVALTLDCRAGLLQPRLRSVAGVADRGRDESASIGFDRRQGDLNWELGPIFSPTLQRPAGTELTAGATPLGLRAALVHAVSHGLRYQHVHRLINEFPT